MGFFDAVHTDVPVTLMVVVISTLVLMGDFVTNPVEECTLSGLHGPWSATAGRPEVLITERSGGRRRLQAWGYEVEDPYQPIEDVYGETPYQGTAMQATPSSSSAPPASHAPSKLHMSIPDRYRGSGLLKVRVRVDCFFQSH